jgi:hypothetical protein
MAFMSVLWTIQQEMFDCFDCNTAASEDMMVSLIFGFETSVGSGQCALSKAEIIWRLVYNLGF